MNNDTHAQAEGREFLRLVTEVTDEVIDGCDGYEIEAWLYELGYEWNGAAWVAVAVVD